jgi:hypothetical protein
MTVVVWRRFDVTATCDGRSPTGDRGSRDGGRRVTSVVYVANSGKIGGGNRVMMDMVTGIDRTRFAPVVVVPEVGSLLSWAKHMKIPARVLTAGGSHREGCDLTFLRRVASFT